MDWTEVIHQATNLCAGSYKIIVRDNNSFAMQSRRSEVHLSIEKSSNDSIIIRSGYWIPSTGIGLLLNWFEEKHYPYTHIRDWPE